MGGSSCSLLTILAVIGSRPGRKGIQESSKNYPSVSDMLGQLKRATCTKVLIIIISICMNKQI